jgi:heme/copper-type cytochrome/quinol oxidase subunit 1
VNLIVTILNYRLKGMTLNKLPLFVWMVLVNSFLLLAAFPSLNAALAMLLLDRQFNAHFFNTDHGGSALLWQHLFWIFGHPEVYILILPPFGILSEVFQVFSRKPIFGYPFVAASSVAIALLAFGVWAHHMFAVGLGNNVDSFFSASSMLIGIPTGVKIFNWLATMYGGKIRFTVSMLFAIAFLIEFTIGGLSGIAFSIVPIDWQLTDTYYVVAHIHYVFIGGTIFGLLAGLFYWFPKMTGKMLEEKLGRWFFWLFVIGFNLTFLVQHALGMLGMPRRVYTYPALPGYAILNFISTTGAFLMGASVLLLVYIIRNALKKGRPAGADPWDAYTLEWATSSPPALKNFDMLPAVNGRRPFRDMKQAVRALPGDGTPIRSHKEGRSMQASQPDNKIMIKLVVGTEAMFFICLIMAFIYMAFHSGFEPHELNKLDIRTTGVYTLLLIASSVTLLFAESCLKKEKRRGVKGWLFITLLLGATFLFGQGKEYLRLIRGNVTLSGSVFGTSFFTLTGFHGLHVLIGLIILSVILLLTFLRDRRPPDGATPGQKPGPPDAPTAGDKPGTAAGSGGALGTAAIYWHFVDIVWIVVFTVVYVLPKFTHI